MIFLLEFTVFPVQYKGLDQLIGLIVHVTTRFNCPFPAHGYLNSFFVPCLTLFSEKISAQIHSLYEICTELGKMDKQSRSKMQNWS